MKKGQSGVSLIALVITIIVVIILAAIAFGTSTRTITNANYSTFTNAVGEVRTALQERVTTVKGEEAAKGRTRTDAQVYNFVAKGGDIVRQGGYNNANGTTVSGDISGDNNAAWLSRGAANLLSATRIEPTVIKEALGLKNLNTIKVNTDKGQGIEVSYFVTRSGDVFVWPPYEYEGKYYVNDNKNVTVAKDAANSDKTDTIIDFGGNVKVYVSNTASATAPTSDATAYSVAATTKTVYYLDKAGADMPKGVETDKLFNDGSNN